MTVVAAIGVFLIMVPVALLWGALFLAGVVGLALETLETLAAVREGNLAMLLVLCVGWGVVFVLLSAPFVLGGN